MISASGQPKAQYATIGLQAGAASYFTKDNAAEELSPAIMKILGVGC